MPDEIISPEIASTLHAEAVQRRELPAWIVFRDDPDYPGKVIARFATDTPSSSYWWLTRSPNYARCCRPACG